MYDVITIGDCTMDTFIVIDHDEASLQCGLKRENCLLCLNYADKIPIKQTGQSVGGDAANVAVALKKLGLNTAIASELGNDINGHIIKNELEKTGVGAKMLKMLPGKETRYSVILGYQGERTVLSYYCKRDYSMPALPAAKWIYYSSLGKTFEKIQNKLIKHMAKHPSVRLAVNPGSWQMKNGLNKIKQILPLTDLLFVNKEEAAILLGKKKTISGYLISFLNLGIGTAVITDSTNGSYASNGKKKYFMPIFPALTVDKTGAGDAYASGFLGALLYGKSIPEAMTWGTANACAVTTKIGAEHGLLDKKQILKTIKKYKNIRPKMI